MVCLALGGAAGWVGRGAVPPTAAPVEPMTQAAVSAFRTYVVEAVHAVEVRADGTPHLEQWLSGRVGRPVRVPDLQAQGFRLMGAGACCRPATSGGDADVRRRPRHPPDGLQPRRRGRGTRRLPRYAREGDVAASRGSTPGWPTW